MADCVSDSVDSFAIGKRTRVSIKSAKPVVEEKKEVSAKKKHKKKAYDWDFDKINDDLTDSVKIATNVTVEEFEKFDSEMVGSEGYPKTKYEYIDGDVFAYKLPDRDHEAISHFFAKQLFAYNDANGGRWDVGRSQRIRLGPGIIKMADESFFLLDRNVVAGLLQEQPVAVFETGDSQTVSLHSKVALWFGATTRVQIVVWIKVWPARADGTRQMVAVHYERATGQVPVSAVSFGTANIARVTRNSINGFGTAMTGVGCGGVACSAAGIAAYQITLPGNLLIEGDPAGAAAVAGPNLVLDLFVAQQAIARAARRT